MNFRISSLVKALGFSMSFFIGSQCLAQKFEFGKFSEEELKLEVVPFEPEAKQVVLMEEANSYFMVNGIHTDYYHRIKILDNISDYQDVVIWFFRGENLTEDVVKLQAQISFLEEGIRKEFKLGKEHVKEVKLGEGAFEYRLIFPNVKKGSIIEYSYKKIDHQVGILEGWQFQRDIPILSSKYTFKAPIFFQYQMIVQGSLLADAAEISEKKRTYSWKLTNVPSLPEEPYVQNLMDYQERVDGYLFTNKYVLPDSLEVSDIFYGSWRETSDQWLESTALASYLGPSPTDAEFKKMDFKGINEKETARNIFQYVTKNFTTYDSYWLEPGYELIDFLKEKEGNDFDINMLLSHILDANGIKSNLVMVNERGKGRSAIIETPYIHQFDGCILKATLDGQDVFLDASDSIMSFGMVPLEKLVSRGFILEKNAGRLNDLSIPHRSGMLNYSTLNKNSDGHLIFNQTIKYTDYEALKVGMLLRSEKEKAQVISDLDSEISFEDLKITDQLKEKRAITIEFQQQVEEATDEFLELYPHKYSKFSKNPFTQNSRILPIEFDYPYFETLNAIIPIPDGYELYDFPESINITIPSKNVRFSYQVVTNDQGLLINGKLELLSNKFSADQYADLKYFMENVAFKLGEPIVLKKTASL